MNIPWASGFRYVVVTLWGYPGGGGESFMRDTLVAMDDAGAETIWVCFESMKTGKPFARTEAIAMGKRGGIL